MAWMLSMRAVDRVSLIIDEKTKNPIRLTFGDGSIGFLCVTPIGKAEDVCACEGACDNLEIGFNDRYLMEALKAAPAAKLTISLNTGSSPCILTPAEGGESFVYMPAANSAAAATRSPAACTAWAPPWSTPFPSGWRSPSTGMAGSTACSTAAASTRAAIWC